MTWFRRPTLLGAVMLHADQKCVAGCALPAGASASVWELPTETVFVCGHHRNPVALVTEYKEKSRKRMRANAHKRGRLFVEWLQRLNDETREETKALRAVRRRFPKHRGTCKYPELPVRKYGSPDYPSYLPPDPEVVMEEIAQTAFVRKWCGRMTDHIYKTPATPAVPPE